MTQTYTDNCYQAGNVGQTDLQNIENNFAALKSNFSGTSTPANSVAGMIWFDTDADTNNKGVQKFRNNDGDWFGLLHGDSSHIILVYRNTAIDGWAVSSAVTDRVVAIKGGSTYTTGGATAGSWVVSGITAANESSHNHDHGHKWYVTRGASDNDETYNSSGSYIDLPTVSSKSTNVRHLAISTSTADTPPSSMWTDWDDTSGSTHTHTVSQNGNWRISAAVFTLQYIDI